LPVIRPEKQRAKRRGQLAAAYTGAHADDIAASIELRLDENRPGLDLAEVAERLLQCFEALLLAVAHVADHEAIGDHVIGKLPPKRQVDHVRVEPEVPHAIDSRLEIESESDPVLQRLLDRGIQRVLDARIELNDTLVEIDVGRADLQHTVERGGHGELARQRNQQGSGQDKNSQPSLRVTGGRAAG
jgi:hypothetical protein